MFRDSVAHTMPFPEMVFMALSAAVLSVFACRMVERRLRSHVGALVTAAALAAVCSWFAGGFFILPWLIAASTVVFFAVIVKRRLFSIALPLAFALCWVTGFLAEPIVRLIVEEGGLAIAFVSTFGDVPFAPYAIGAFDVLLWLSVLMLALGCSHAETEWGSSVLMASLDEDDSLERMRHYLEGRGLQGLQIDVALGIVRGDSLSALSEALHYSPGSINTAKTVVYRALGVHDRRQLIAHIVRGTGISLSSHSENPSSNV